MRYYSQNQTELLNGLKDTLQELNKDNRWVRLADALPWASIEIEYNKRLRNEHAGAKNKPARMVVGAMIVKHMMNLSDEETVLIIQENPYMQYLLGLTEYRTAPVFTPELLTVARKRLGEDFFNEVTLMLRQREGCVMREDCKRNSGGYTDEDGERHEGVMKVDATCTEAEMKFPTDIGLLEDGSREVDRLTKKISARLGLREPITRRGQSRSVFVCYTKRKHKGSKLVRQTKQCLTHYLRSDIETLMDILAKVPSDRLTSILKTRDIRNLEATLEMLAQQEEMLSLGARSCHDRIVSIFQPHVRPIVRGKAKAKTEFGAKAGISVVNGYTFLDNISWDAYNESADMFVHIENYKKRFGVYPAEVQADKIYLNKENRSLLKKMHIQCHCAPLGRPPKAPDPEKIALQRKASGERNEVEASFGTAKRRYGADNIRAKLPDTARSWVASCFLAKNLKKFLRGILFRLFRFFELAAVKNGIFPLNPIIACEYCNLVRLYA